VNNTAIRYRESNSLICFAFFIYFTNLQFSLDNIATTYGTSPNNLTYSSSSWHSINAQALVVYLSSGWKN